MKMKNDAIYGAIAGDVIGSAYEFKGARFEPIQLFKMCDLLHIFEQHNL